MKKHILLIATAMLTQIYLAVGQNKPCGTDEAMQDMYNANPGMLQEYMDLRAYAKKYTQEVFVNQTKGPVRKIPIVFHVVHNYGSENISDATILAALDVMNDHWRKLDADTVNIHAPFDLIHKDMEIEFVLAKKDPNGDCTTGITRTVSELTNSAGDNVKAVTKAVMDWPRSRYLNVWIVANIASGAGGYSYYPSNGNAPVDGIVVLAQQLSALAHEAGHWLALPHPWGNSNDNNLATNCNIDDGIDDTPNTQGQSVCNNLNRNSCNDDPVPFLDIHGNILWPSTNGEIHDNVQNYMDYAFCFSGENFTEGQKAVCWSVLDNSTASRNNLWIPSNLTLTGTEASFTCEPTPIPDFQLPYEYVCTDFGFQVQNNTYNYNTISYDWDFDVNSSASSTTAKEPTLSYAEPGKYDISLTASNNSGGSRTKTKTDIAKIISGEPIAPITESFKSLTWPVNHATNWSKNWFLDGNWQRTTAASTEGNSAAWLNIKTVNGVHRMISPMMDLTQMNCTDLTFDVAYAPRTTNTNDIFRVKVSKTCGRTWPSTSWYEVEKQDIAPNTPLITGDFVPTASDWKTHTINLSNLSSEDAVVFMFEVETNGGNAIYIDNISFGCATPDASNEAIALALDVFPNPTEDDANIRISGTTGAANFQITDVTGKLIASKSIMLNENATQVSVSGIVGRSLEKGVYLIAVQNGNQTETRKLIIK